MRDKRALMTATGCLCAGAIAGYFLGARPAEKSSAEPPAEAAPSIQPARASSLGMTAATAIPRSASGLSRLQEAIQDRRNPDLVLALSAIRELAREDCARAMQAIRGREPEGRELLLRAVGTRWAELDPHHAFSHALLQPDRESQWAVGQRAATALAVLDPEGALQKIIESKGADRRIHVASWILPAVAKVNPQRAAQFLQSVRDLSTREDLYRGIAREYALVSPVEALKWAGSLQNKQLREETSHNAWSAWAEQDPAAVASALGIRASESAPNYAFEQVAKAWSRRDIHAAIQWMNSLPPDTQQNAARHIDLRLETISPAEASALVSSASGDALRSSLGRLLSGVIAGQDPQEAVAWAETLPDGPAKAQALRPAFDRWAASDPGQAAQYARQLTDPDQRSELTRRAVERWSREDPMAVAHFAQQLPEGKERDTALAYGIRALASENPAQAMGMFQTIQDPEVLGDLAGEMIGPIARADSAAAIALARQMPAEAHPKAYHALIRSWGFEGMQEAGQWINTLAPGAAKDAAIKAYVSVIDGADAALATKWATTIQDPTERTEAVFGAFERWSRESPENAKQWLDTATVPEGLRPFFDKHLRESMARRRN